MLFRANVEKGVGNDHDLYTLQCRLSAGRGQGPSAHDSRSLPPLQWCVPSGWHRRSPAIPGRGFVFGFYHGFPGQCRQPRLCFFPGSVQTGFEVGNRGHRPEFSSGSGFSAFGDASSGEGREGYHRYIEAGTYTWTLTVVDDSGDTQEVNGSIYIKDRPLVPDGGPGTNDDEPTESPGPGAIVALATLALVGITIALRRKRQQA